MTLESTITRVAYEGNGVTRKFPLPFPLLAASHVEVYVTDMDIADSMAVSPLAAGYRVEDIALREPYLVYPEDAEAPALKAGRKLTVVRRLPLVQQTNLENGGNLQAETLETQFDTIVMQLQQLAYDLDRAVKVPPYSSKQRLDVTDLLAHMEALCHRAEDAAQRVEKQADMETVLGGTSNLSATWALTESLAAGDLLTLPVHYMPWRNMLILSVDGVLCYPAKKTTAAEGNGQSGNEVDVGGQAGSEPDGRIAQYEELLGGEEFSNQVRVHFPLPKGSVCHALVLMDKHSAMPEEAEG